MPQHFDAPLDSDPLLEFTTEPELRSAEGLASTELPQAAAAMEVPPSTQTMTATEESTGAVGADVTRLERAVERSIIDVAMLRAEMATLVASVDDINRRSLHASTISQRPRTAVAVAAMLVGIAIGVSGWMAWSGGALDEKAAVTVPVAAAELPPAIETPPVAQTMTPASTTTVASTTVASTAPPPAAVKKARPARVATPLPVPEVAYVGTLSIDATPPGSQVFINRRAAGNTPLRVENLRAGSHLVWIERDGYRRWTQVVEVRSDRVSRVSVSLEPLAAR